MEYTITYVIAFVLESYSGMIPGIKKLDFYACVNSVLSTA